MPLTRFSVPALHTVTRQLAAVAMQQAEPDLVIRGGRVFSTYTERIHEGKEVWIKSGRIAAVKPAGTWKKTKGSATRAFDARGGIVAPGLVDPHIHIESSMMTACAYAEAALLNGTTTIFCDSHEIGNVCDVAGIEWMLKDARVAPLNIFLTVPSTVPATSPKFETAGGDLTAAKIGQLFDKWPEAVALGEKMDFVQVAMGDERSHAVLGEAIKRGKPISGHIYGREFVAAGAASGINDTHEAIDRDIADDFLENGVWVFLRGGPPTTPWHSLPEAIKTVTELGANPKRVCVCTDDRDADDLFVFGLDWVVREAMRAGMPRETALSMGSLHPATRFHLDNEIGGMGPARRADLVLMNDDLEPQCTWYGGELVVKNRRVTPLLEEALSQPYRYPKAAYRTVKLPRNPQLTPALPTKKVTANTIRTELPGIILFHDRVELEAADSWDAHFAQHDLCFVTVVERHGKSGEVAHGLLKNFGLKSGAVASSVGHDAHNIIIAGTNDADMQLALATIKASRGGVCIVRHGKVVAEVALPIAGLLSDLRARDVAKASTKLKRAWAQAGCTLPYMGFNLIPLSVIPEIRITDKGLVTVPGMQILPLFE
ncbi:adenine deaminase [Synoicihabitans lomoniglobus]|uniref:Adenine deaminase n=1 Tax=Synoicihabitans lomoniglobus TaxID=2909285 RepID=A0AAF0CSB0_9BACT|nr:amidohydrolase family protein [Opitutaceae bacterium LMO-M01]WED67160.1 adenine deaminase C-terminal domain-containing protein [Opitutaceae bacterium LMO-M01]